MANAAISMAERKAQLNWAVVGLLMALCFISHLNRISMSVAADERIMKQYAIAPEKMGMVYSAFLLIYTLLMIPGGFFIDRFGARAALATMGFGSALFCGLTGVVGTIGADANQLWLSLILVRGLMGLFTTPLHPGAAKAVGLWVPASKRSLANGLVTGSALLGIACTYKVFGSLVINFDWPKAFLTTGVVTALITVVWLAVSPKRDPSERSPTITSKGWKALLRNRNVLLLTLSYAAVGYFQYLFFYWMHYYFDEVLHLGKEASRYYAGIPPLVMAICMPFGGWMSDRLRTSAKGAKAHALVPFCGMVLGALLLGAGVMAQTPFWIVFWFSLALGAVGTAEGAFWSRAVEAGGRYGGAAAAIVNTGGNGGGMLAPVITPWASQQFGWPVGIGLGGAICLAGAICWLGMKTEDQPENEEASVNRATA